MIFLAAFMAFDCMGASLPSQVDSHDIASLHAWGPYSKRYAGISHIPDMSKGIRFDFSVMPGYTIMCTSRFRNILVWKSLLIRGGIL